MKKREILQTGFSLIEMLAVMFIIGIIFSITAPAFGPMMRTLKLTTSAENLANVLESARQYAVTNGENCYVVFPTSTGTDMDYKAYKIYSLSSGTIGRWEFLPNSIKIDSGCTFITAPPNPPTITINFPEDDDVQSQKPVIYIEFKTNGAATLNRTIGLTVSNTNLIQEIVFYNQPLKIKVEDVRKK